jgi:hypothetical protein
MPRDLTLEDLASSEATEQAAEEAAETAAETAADAAADESPGDTAKWLTELYSQMREDGTLQAILFGPEAAQEMDRQQVDPRQQQMQEPTTNAETEAPSEQVDPTDVIDAETIAAVGNVVIEKVGDMPISQVVEACEERPATINNVLEQHADELVAANADAADVEAEPADEQEADDARR